MFLQTLVNARDVANLSRLIKRYADFFPVCFPSDSATARQVSQLPGWKGFPEMAANASRLGSIARLHEFAFGLRQAWDEPDQRIRDWRIYELRRKFHEETNPDRKGEPPSLTPFEQAMFHFQRIAGRARHCPNPTCSTPYFLATKKGQKYCSEPCAIPAQREAKRRWWAENRGKELTS
jgi:hypothetical protein